MTAGASPIVVVPTPEAGGGTPALSTGHPSGRPPTTLPALGPAFRGGVAAAWADRSGLVVYGLIFLLPPSVLAGLWRVAAEASGGALVGYDATALVWYVATAEAAILCLRTRMIEEIGHDLGTGRLEVELLRPARAVAVRVANEAGWLLPRLGVSVVLAVLLALVLGGAPPSATALALAVPALALAVLTNLVAHHLFAGAAFWVRDATGMWFLYQKLVFVLGGMLLPLEVLPASVAAVARALPFMAMAYAPARLAAGFAEPRLLAVQAGWLVTLAAATVLVFAAGERRLVREGG